MNEMTARPGHVVFSTKTGEYIAELIHPVPSHPGLIAHENEWKLSLLTYHRTREGKPVERKRSQQIPRTKIQGFFCSLEACRDFLQKIDKR